MKHHFEANFFGGSLPIKSLCTGCSYPNLNILVTCSHSLYYFYSYSGYKMLGRKWIVFSLILCSFFASVVVSTFPNVPQCNESEANRLHCIFVDPENGLDNSSCLTSKSPNISCNSLDWVFNITYRSNQTVYVLSNGTHNISSPVAIFQNLNNIL